MAPLNTLPRNTKRLLAMSTAYALGSFNDNFFKQAALLLAVSAQLTEMQGYATVAFALPFIICAAWAGWLADRLPKERIVVSAKCLELIAMCVGAYGIIAVDWSFIIAMVAIMGLQSVIFGPALNGSIPELFEPKQVAGVNAMLKSATIISILIGIALAGVALDQTWGQAWLPQELVFGRALVGVVCIAAAIIGLMAALTITGTSANTTSSPFPWAGPLNSLKDCRLVLADAPLALALAGEAYFYFMSSLAMLVINNLGIDQLGFSMTQTSLLSAALMVGVCLGAVLAAKSSPLSWRVSMAPACLAMGVALGASGLCVWLSPAWQIPYLLTLYALTGIAGGIYLIPLTSFIQVRPRVSEKGRVQGISYFATFSGISIAGGIFVGLGKLPPSWGIILVGMLSVAASALWFIIKLRIRDKILSISPASISLQASTFTSEGGSNG